MPESKWVREEDQPAMTCANSCARASCERGARRYRKLFGPNSPQSYR
jgi:hypothetical protein